MLTGPPIGRRAGHVAAADQHLALARLLEAADHAQAGRLAAAGRPEQGDEGGRRDGEIDAADRCDRAVALGDRAKLDIGHCGQGSTGSSDT